MRGIRTPLHARDHRPPGTLGADDDGGADPMTWLNQQGLPPWFDYTPSAHLAASAGGGDTAPTLTIIDAKTMVQTVNGVSFLDGGQPLENGSCFLDLFVQLLTVGETASGGNSPGVISVDLTTEPDSYNAVHPSDRYVIGSGYVCQTSTKTFLQANLLSTGEILVPNVPDVAPPSGLVSNLVRIANAHEGTLAWPFDWAEGDTLYNGTGLFSMGVD